MAASHWEHPRQDNGADGDNIKLMDDLSQAENRRAGSAERKNYNDAGGTIDLDAASAMQIDFLRNCCRRFDYVSFLDANSSSLGEKFLIINSRSASVSSFLNRTNKHNSARHRNANNDVITLPRKEIPEKSGKFTEKQIAKTKLLMRQ